MTPTIVINPFRVPPGKESQAIEEWDRFAEYFRRQPGYRSAALHRALTPEAPYHLVTVAEWASAEDFLAALRGPELHALAQAADRDIQSFPGLYEIIRR